jgi:hypothetical protein
MTVGVSWIDLTLAVRMLARSPGLTAVSVLGLAVAIAIALGAFTITGAIIDPSLPLADGDRVVSIMNWQIRSNTREQRVLYEYARWRELDTFEDLGAARYVSRNLVMPGVEPATVQVAEMTASGFALARVGPLLGRHLRPEDERPGAPDVVVIGHDVWTRRFHADPAAVGRTLQLGATVHTVVGVMPEGFAFPVHHSYWVPWRLDPARYEPRTGPSIEVFARLAPGVTLERAQARLAAIAQATAAAFPPTHEHLRAKVRPYAYGLDLAAYPLDGAGAPIAMLKSPVAEIEGQFSPDGKLFLYASNQSGRFEVYVEPWPQTGERWAVSTTGGTDGRWSPDGREIFYLTPDRRLMAVPVRTTPTFVAGRPVELFQTRVAGPLGLGHRFPFAVAKDGQRFLMYVTDPDGPPPALSVIANWHSLVGGR